MKWASKQSLGKSQESHGNNSLRKAIIFSLLMPVLSPIALSDFHPQSNMIDTQGEKGEGH